MTQVVSAQLKVYFIELINWNWYNIFNTYQTLLSWFSQPYFLGKLAEMHMSSDGVSHFLNTDSVN